MKKVLLLLATLLLSASLSLAGQHKEDDNKAAALRGLQETKAYFDVTIGNPKLLLVRLQLVEKTYNQFVAAGITPTFILGVRGKASRFITNGTNYVLDIDHSEKERITALIKKLKTAGVTIEQCSIAAGFEDIDVKDFLPEVELVANGYVSMIGYQSQGYGFVPMD